MYGYVKHAKVLMIQDAVSGIVQVVKKKFVITVLIDTCTVKIVQKEKQTLS